VLVVAKIYVDNIDLERHRKGGEERVREEKESWKKCRL